MDTGQSFIAGSLTSLRRQRPSPARLAAALVWLLVAAATTCAAAAPVVDDAAARAYVASIRPSAELWPR